MLKHAQDKKTIQRNQVKRTYYQAKFPFLAERIFLQVAQHPLSSTLDLVYLFTKSPKNMYPHGRITYVLKQLLDIDYVDEFGVVTGPKHQCSFKSQQYFFEVEKKDRVIDFIKKNSKVEKNPRVYGQKVSYGMICKHCKKFVQVKLKGDSKFIDSRHWKLSFNGNFVLLSILDDEERWDLIKNSDNDILKLAKLLMVNQKKQFVVLLIKRLRKVVREEPDLIPIAKSWYKEMLKKILKFKIDKSNQREFAKYQTELELEQQSEIIMSARHGHFTRKFG